MTDWVIPAITASASLLGTMVGGIATYWTSKKTHERQSIAEEERQKFDLLRDATIRFVSAMTEISVASAGLKEISAEWAEVTQRLAHADIADSAQRVIYTAFAQEITSALSPDRRNAAVDAFNAAINDFVNRVRHYMHVEDHEFDAIDQKALQHLLDF